MEATGGALGKMPLLFEAKETERREQRPEADLILCPNMNVEGRGLAWQGENEAATSPANIPG